VGILSWCVTNKLVRPTQPPAFGWEMSTSQGKVAVLCARKGSCDAWSVWLWLPTPMGPVTAERGRNEHITYAAIGSLISWHWFSLCLCTAFACHCGANYRAKLQLPESLLPKSLVAKHVRVPDDGILMNLHCSVVLHDVVVREFSC